VLLMDSANSMHEIARKFVAGDEGHTTTGAPTRTAYSP